MLTELKRRVDEHNEDFNDEVENVRNRSHRDEEYNNWTEKYSREAQQQTT